MKLKCRPDDFLVEEFTRFERTGGPFAVYHLRKQSIGTPEAIDAICDRWRIHRSRISFGGMKDRHAVTTQTLTILNGPKRGLQQNQIDLTYVGQAPRPFAPADIEANRFAIVMRDMTQPAIDRAYAALREIAEHGLPNYFDDQRFGSVGESGQFIAQPWCLGDFERALWLVIAEPNTHDRPEDRDRKKILRDHWGQWPAIAGRIKRSPIDRILQFLAERPTDYRNAFANLRADMRDLYLAAFQSFLWNRMLSLFICDRVPAAHVSEVKFDHATLAFHRSLPAGMKDSLREMLLPLPSARAKIEDEATRLLAERALREVGMELKQLKTKTPRDVYFSRGDRAAFVFPEAVAATDAEDDLHPGRRAMTLRFDLRRGCYATILVKRITTLAEPATP